MRSLATPIIGATSVPRYCSAPNTVSHSTDPVSTSTYQPRISVSISNAHEVKRSAGHWKRKLRDWNGASIEKRGAIGAAGAGPRRRTVFDLARGLGWAVEHFQR